jgi:tetratricopeptide (TPR) repeat protein
MRQQKYLDAEAVFQKVLEENPGYYKAYNKLGVLKSQKGDWPGAAISFKKAIDLTAMDYRAIQMSGAELYCNYGEALAQQGLYAKAKEALLQVLRISPESQYGQKAKQILASIEGAG